MKSDKLFSHYNRNDQTESDQISLKVASNLFI